MQTLDAQFTRELDVEPGSYVVVAITDNRHGMPKELQAVHFVPFFTTKEVGSGRAGPEHGLRFCQAKRWSCQDDSEVGHGTVVKIYLPAIVTTASELESTDGTSSAGYGTILVVEDDDLLRQTVVRKLVRLGYGVTAVARLKAPFKRWRVAIISTWSSPTSSCPEP